MTTYLTGVILKQGCLRDTSWSNHFLININDLQTVVNGVKYVDDSSLWEAYHKSGSDSHLQEAADQASAWTVKTMQANTDKTKYMEIYFGTVPLTLQPIVINDSEIHQVL